MTDYSPQVRAYLSVVVFAGASLPAVDGEGHISLLCPSPCEHHHQARIHVDTGRWQCRSCQIQGDLRLYEMWRKGWNPWKAEGTIREAVDVFRERQKARAIAVERNLSAPACSLFKRIFVSPGVSRRYLQQVSHLSRRQFGLSLRELDRGGLIRCTLHVSTGGRFRRCYYVQTPL